MFRNSSSVNPNLSSVSRSSQLGGGLFQRRDERGLSLDDTKKCTDFREVLGEDGGELQLLLGSSVDQGILTREGGRCKVSEHARPGARAPTRRRPPTTRSRSGSNRRASSRRTPSKAKKSPGRSGARKKSPSRAKKSTRSVSRKKSATTRSKSGTRTRRSSPKGKRSTSQGATRRRSPKKSGIKPTVPATTPV